MDKQKTHVLMMEANEKEASYVRHRLDVEDFLETRSNTLFNGTMNLSEVEVVLPFVHSHIGAEEIAAMPNLKLIATRSTGYDHIDLHAASARGIKVANVPAYGETAVAEYTFALLLALSRKIHQAWVHMRDGEYSIEELRGFDLYGKTLGVIGAGAIGLHVIRIAKGFGMNVLAYDVVHNQLLSEVLGFQYAELDEVLKQSDVVTLHAPALPSTHHMINREKLELMKRGSLIINTARGSLIDTRALAWALDTRILAGAGLDTLEGEEFLEHEEELLNAADTEAELKLLVNNNMLLRRQNVIITPHIAFNSDEALLRILDTTISNVQAFLADRPQNIVKVQ
ncbi:NAD(P)-dependent oxidoreductase [Tengunoibacter tsumagoiensis]|uniref:Lactate dehydrogenase n=1 Tax=Tengunoibacter tsumagoiensis TaxID=2014871 RepID=A0A401ZXP9_9CHLR|nr:NAD(P)-dependent oxidoreductase [Tengunoibacter tsumagoiensis]GCE11619.1 lactate dehydrogenase [Tengunoibacter tsumagoiensis]